MSAHPEPALRLKDIYRHPAYNPAAFLNAVIKKLGLKNMVALSRLLNVTKGELSRVRCKTMPLGATLTVRIMEETGASLKDLYRWMGVL